MCELLTTGEQEGPLNPGFYRSGIPPKPVTDCADLATARQGNWAPARAEISW